MNGGRGRIIPTAGPFAPGRRSEPPRADVGVGEPAAQAGDLDDVARVRSVDDLVAADVDALVGEAVEEDEVAGLELAARDRSSVAVLRGGVVRQRDPELRVDVHDEARAVEAGRRRTSPDVGDAEVAERDRRRV